MTAYIINYLLCSFLLYLPFKLWLEKTSMHNFKRIYLLFVLIAPIIIPKIEYEISIKTEQNVLHIPNANYIDPELIVNENIPIAHDTAIENHSPKINWADIITIVYLSITILLFIRFAKNSIELFKRIKKYPQISTTKYHIVLSEDAKTPYSFFSYIFVNPANYINGISTAIWKHEEAHVNQYHSIDILILELIKIFAWFNPTHYFLKSTIQLNHEYLADEYVLRDRSLFQEYGYLLLNLSKQQSQSLLTSQLHYKQIKTRLIMMTKKTSKYKQLCLTTVATCIVLVVIAVCAQKNILIAKTIDSIKDQSNIAQAIKANAIDTTKETGAPQKLLAEYDSVMNSITTYKKNNKGHTIRTVNFSKIDRNRMAFIATLMSDNQIKERTQSSHDPFSPRHWTTKMTKPEKRTPSKKEFDNWQNASVYGVWIDGKKSKNTALKNFKNTDFALYYVSKLLGKAKVGRSYTHQLDVYTLPYYEKIYANRQESPKASLKK